jgi:TolB-like protein
LEYSFPGDRVCSGICSGADHLLGLRDHSQGLKREKEVVRDASITHLTAKRLDWITIGLMVAVLAFIVADRFWMSPRHPEQSAVPVEVVTDHEPTSEPEATESQYPPNSIAVLPFANRSANPDDAYFVDGIHDDLLTHISKIGAIKTISRTSVMQYRGSSKSIPEIATELGVATILEGGVQRAGDQVRINVQLIDARNDEHLWAEIYDRQLLATNIFAIQSEIAEAIAEALRMTLSPREQQRIRSVPTESLAAYEAYLIGKQRLAKRTTQSMAEADLAVDETSVVADRGYYRNLELKACEEAGIITYVPNSSTSPNKAKGKFDRSVFRYIAADDEYECPAGQRLAWRMTSEEKDMTLHRYWSDQCGGCALKGQCTTGKHRRMTRWEHEAVIDRVRARLQRRADVMRRRRATVEHPFGTLKAWMGSTHFLTKTLPRVNTEMSLHVLAYNLKRMMNLVGTKPLIEAITA